MKKLVIREREYLVQPRTAQFDGETSFILTGKRGAQYITMRNVKNPHMMFLNPMKGYSPVMDGVWLSDKNGYPEVVKE